MGINIKKGGFMRCRAHEKAFIGLCTWCGSQLCNKCVVRQDGVKLYCSACAQKIEKVPRRVLPAEPKKTKQEVERIELEAEEQPKVELWY